MNHDEAETVFSKIMGSTGSMANNKTDGNNEKPFHLSEVYEISQPRPSYFQDRNRQKLIFKS